MAGQPAEGPPARPAPGREGTGPAGKHVTGSCLPAAPQGPGGEAPSHDAGISAGLGYPRTIDPQWGCSPRREQGCLLAPMPGACPRTQLAHPSAPCFCGVPRSSPRLLRVLEGGCTLARSPQRVRDGCPQQAGEDAARAALISLQGQGCARRRGRRSHGLAELSPGTACGGREGNLGLVQAAGLQAARAVWGWRARKSNEKPL